MRNRKKYRFLGACLLVIQIACQEIHKKKGLVLSQRNNFDEMAKSQLTLVDN